MKTNFWKSAAALTLGLAAMVACEKGPKEEPKNEAPVFPTEVIEKNVEAGETVELTFAANLDWELSIPASEQTKYWLDDAGMPASKVSGKAGNQTVSVVFSEDEYYDENVLCNVTLTMGGESKVIAKLTRLAINRSLEVYTAEVGDWSFEKTYSTVKAESLELTTFEGDVTYTLPIQVVANFDWSLALPEWCEGQIKVAEGETAPESLSGQAGKVVEVLLTGKISEAVKAGASDFAKFIDAADNTKSVDLALAFPAFENRVEFTEPATMKFNADGTASMPTIAYVLAMEGFVVKALEWDGERHSTEFVDWVTAEFEEGEESASLLSQVAFTLGVTENTGEERVADLFVFPASMANVTPDLICKSNNCAVYNEDYAPYYVGRISQAGKAEPYLSEYQDLDMSVETYKASLSNLTASPWWASQVSGLSLDNMYELAYWDEYSALQFQFATPCEHYKIFDYDFNEVSEEAQSDFWLEFMIIAADTRGVVWMYPEKFNVPGVETPESFIVLYDNAGEPLAAICCKYTATGGGEASEVSITSTDGTAEIVNDLSQTTLTPGSLSSLVESGFGMGAPGAEFVIMASEAESYFTTSFSFANIFVLTTDGQLVESPAGFSVYASSNTTFRVTASADAEYLLLFMDANGGLPAVAYYSYAAPAGPEQPEQPTGPISFVYPNEVQGATLEKANYETFPSAVSNLGLQMANTYVLTYTTQNPVKATLNVPGNPKWNSAYDNWTADPAYWLTHSMVTATTMDVYMKEADKVDFFVFNDTYALVCKYVPDGSEEGGEEGNDEPLVLTPTETLMFTSSYANCTLDVMDGSNPLCKAIYEKYNTPNIWHMTIKGQTPLAMFSKSLTTVDVLTTDFAPATVPALMVQGTMFMIHQPTSDGVQAILLLKNGDDVLGVVYYEYSF